MKKHYSFVDDYGAVHGVYAVSEEAAWEVLARAFPHFDNEKLHDFFGLCAVEEIDWEVTE